MDFLLDTLKKEDISNGVYVIGIDGLGGAGKSTEVRSLKKRLQNENYSCTVIHIDDFIHPRHVRYDESKEEWDCYYNIQWRYDYLVEEVLEPIKRGEGIDKFIEIYNKERDFYDLQRMCIPQGTVVILEGIFIQRKEIKNYLDYIIYINVSQETRLKRVLERDGYIGDSNDIKGKYERRYFPAEEKYTEEYDPIEGANIVLGIE